MRLPLILVLFVAGCSEVIGGKERPTLLLRTDETTYVARQERAGFRPTYGFTLVARLENRTGQPVYLTRCYPDSKHPIYGLDLMSPEDDSGAAYNGAWACVGHENPITVAPGSTRIDTLHITGPKAWPSGSPEHFGVLEGLFRLRYSSHWCRDGVDCALPDSLRYSNEFAVQLATAAPSIPGYPDS